MASDFHLHTSASPYSCMSGRLKTRSHSTSKKRSATEAQVLAWSRSRVAGAPAQSESCSAQRLHKTSERPLKLQPLSKTHHVLWARGIDHVGVGGKAPVHYNFSNKNKRLASLLSTATAFTLRGVISGAPRHSASTRYMGSAETTDGKLE